MNLYRSFGNLMEAYVYEGRPHPESQWQWDNADGPHAPVANMGVNPRSDSVDSGVETASCETPNPIPVSFLPPHNTEMDLFLLQSDRRSPVSTPLPPVFSSSLPSSSSSSPNLPPCKVEEDPATLNLNREPDLQRNGSKRWKQVYDVLSQQPKTSSLPKQHTSELKRCIRSASFNLRRRFDPSVSAEQMSETERQPIPVGSVERISQVPGVFAGNEPSPGLCYLEWVCQTMEQYAERQIQNQGSQMKTDALQEHEEQKNDSADAQESQPRLENAKKAKQITSEPQQKRSHPFRQRSASDLSSSKQHLKKLNFKLNSKRQQRSTNDLRQVEEEDSNPMESIQEESNRKSIIQRLKTGSLRRVESAVSDTKSQQMQSSEKITTRRRLSQLFRRSKKVSPD
ncbi:uncharacterized protein LOC105935795 isoform X1 [Fundulus heteroclitus]|uniref:uncharacterized protein LOC105935795 isoform X1 n=1 Tax=Fundulus heteroclitus TaxID=8078 RepID=UPI00165CECB0|nr:uncharacterized protein LOC105935795 isoform X1 [Fundulus heteroclitus]